MNRVSAAGTAGIWAARGLLGVAAVLLFAMLALTCVDVIGRYLLNAPINGKTELTRFMMAGLIASALPVISAGGGHISVDLFDRFFSPR
ncbi:MAG: TRAP transporter small permease, partial [Geminicoccaceae bacterium]